MKKSKRVVSNLLLSLLLPFIALWTGASFYRETFASGTGGALIIAGSETRGLQVEHSENPFAFENLYPGCKGEEQATTVKVSNDGSGDFTLRIEKRLISSGAEELALYLYDGLIIDVIEQGMAENIFWYSGPLKNFERIDVGKVPPGQEARVFKFILTLDEEADNTLQDKHFVLEWTLRACGGVPHLPKTGVLSPPLLCSAVLLLAAGLILGRKALARRRYQ
ncbi:MAG: hypothetical protein GX878_08760 [Firmicutes bacterium]|nr:hypothetical protein [Bacillota bacterium]